MLKMEILLDERDNLLNTKKKLYMYIYIYIYIYKLFDVII